jgi:hypothetical protein
MCARIAGAVRLAAAARRDPTPAASALHRSRPEPPYAPFPASNCELGPQHYAPGSNATRAATSASFARSCLFSCSPHLAAASLGALALALVHPKQPLPAILLASWPHRPRGRSASPVRTLRLAAPSFTLHDSGEAVLHMRGDGPSRGPVCAPLSNYFVSDYDNERANS